MLSRSSTWSVQATVTKIPQAGWLTKNYFLQFWGLEVQGHGTADLVSGESPQPRQLSSLCPLVVEGVEGPLRGLRPKALVPLVWAPPSWPYHLPKAPPPNTSPWESRFQPVSLGNTNIQTTASTTCWKDCFLHWLAFTPLSRVGWLYLCEPISGVSVLFHWCVFSSSIKAHCLD